MQKNEQEIKELILLNRFIETLNSSKSIAITTHIAPDADALCSSLALREIINLNLGARDIDVFVDGEIGELYNPILKDQIINPIVKEKYDLLIVLDCPSAQRTGKYQKLTELSQNIFNIDHHSTNEKFGTQNFVSMLSSSTCELIYLIAKGNKMILNDDIAKWLYQGIITDTNCLSNAIHKRTYSVISELMNFNFDAEKIKEYYFKNNSIEKTKLLTKALQSLKFHKGEKFTTMKLSYETLTKIGASFEDTLGIIDNGINISGTEASAILIEKEEGKVYVSLRSKGEVNVGEVAKSFGGGGSVEFGAYQVDLNGRELKEVERELVEQVVPLLSDKEENDLNIF